LGESNSDWGWLVDDEVLKVTSGDVLTTESEHAVFVGFLSESNSDWGWLVDDEVLKVASGDVFSSESEHTIRIGFLGKSDGDWGWLINDKVLEVASSDILSTEGEHTIGIGFHGLELDKTLSDWGISVLDKGNEGLLGDVLSVEDTDLDGSWGIGLTFPGWGHIIDGVVAIIIWETLIEGFSKSLGAIERIVKWWSSGGLWDSLDHHGDGDVVVVGEVLGFVSILLEDGVEGVITNNLSEGLKSNGLDVIESIGWGNLQGDGLDLIDWDINHLGEFIEVILGLSLGGDKVGSLWCSGWLGGNHDGSLSLWLFVVVLLAVMFLVMLSSSLLGSAGFFKVSFLSLLTLEVLGNHGLNIGVDEALDFTIGKSLGTFAGL